MNLKRGLSGIVPVRNNYHLDYLAVQAVESLLPVCDEVIVVDAQSTDGTREFFLALSEADPKVRVVDFPWTNPVKDTWLMVNWIAAARHHLRYDMQIQLDADEVLHPDGYPEIRRCVAERGARWVRRVNFWSDAQHELPDGVVIGLVQLQLPVVVTETDLQRQTERIVYMVGKARRNLGTMDLVVFPEYSLHGLSMDTNPEIMCRLDGPEVAAFRKACVDNKIWGCFSIMEFNPDGNPYNSGLIIDDHDNLWVCANQSDEIVVVDPTGKVIAKLGDFEGLVDGGTPKGLLFPASPGFSRDKRTLYVTNLALDLRVGTGNPANIAVDSAWAAKVKRWTVSRIDTHFQPLPDK